MVKTDESIEKSIDLYAEHIQHGTKINTAPPVETNPHEDAYNEGNENLQKNNKKHNVQYLNQQVRLNNLKEIDNSKKMTIYILYLILLSSGGLLVFLLK